MAALHPDPGGPQESGSSEEDWRPGSGESRISSWESELVSVQHSLKFVLRLKEEFVCPLCGGVVLDPVQNSCGHIYCGSCLQPLLGSSASGAVCPVDGARITAAEVFHDNCCKREISGLEVYCTNSPACTSVVPLRHLQEHRWSCQYEQLQCPHPGCKVALQRRHLQEHLAATCPQRAEPCPHCRQPQRLSLIQDHVQTSCPGVEVDCPDGCSLKVPRSQLTDHRELCPHLHIHCAFRKYGCSVQDQRVRVRLHEDSAVSEHMLLVLRSCTHLEQQVEVLQQEALLRQQEVQVDGSWLTGLQEDTRLLLHQISSQEHMVAAAQRTLSSQEDTLSTIQQDVQQVSLGLGPGLEELDQLRQSLDAVIQEVSEAEALREHLGTLEENLRDQSGLLDLHAAQLSCNQQHLQELEATSHDGKLIWKIQDFRSKREAEVKGQPPCLSSVPFHTERCGYKMAAKAYLNGDGEGRGTHLSLYVVLLPGDFDALLPWPFQQTVSLAVLDQSGAGNHQSLSFRPDPTSKSFQRPAAGSLSNVAVGFSCFMSLRKLEGPQNAMYIRDDTLFIRVKVDVAGLEPL